MARIAAQLKDRAESKDFAALLNETVKPQTAFEGTVVKGRIIGFTPDDVIVDVGLKAEGRVPMKEFGFAGQKNSMKVGDIIDVTKFELGDLVEATGTSKGKGFAGTVKRHNFNTSKKTHGGNGNVRKPGSIGSMYPQKVFKGKRMAGRMGHDRVTVKNLEVAYVDAASNLIGLKGAVPGPKKGLIVIGGKA